MSWVSSCRCQAASALAASTRPAPPRGQRARSPRHRPRPPAWITPVTGRSAGTGPARRPAPPGRPRRTPPRPPARPAAPGPRPAPPAPGALMPRRLTSSRSRTPCADRGGGLPAAPRPPVPPVITTVPRPHSRIRLQPWQHRRSPGSADPDQPGRAQHTPERSTSCGSPTPSTRPSTAPSSPAPPPPPAPLSAAGVGVGVGAGVGVGVEGG